MECSSIVSLAALCPRDPGSNPGWSAAPIQIYVEFTQIIQAYDRVTPIVITVTVSSLVGTNKYILKCSIDDIIAINMKDIWSRSKWQDCSHYSTGSLNRRGSWYPTLLTG